MVEEHEEAAPGGRFDDGQAVPLVLAVVALAVVVVLALVPLAQAAVAGARARTAADAAALAGAAEGREAAEALARENGGRLVAWRAEGEDVWVQVQVGRARATAKARRDGPLALSYAPGDVTRRPLGAIGWPVPVPAPGGA